MNELYYNYVINDFIKKMIMNYALGTVQFGMKYGISNEEDETSVEEINSILNICKSLK